MLLYVKSYLGADFWKNEELATISSTQSFPFPGANLQKFPQTQTANYGPG